MSLAGFCLGLGLAFLQGKVAGGCPGCHSNPRDPEKLPPHSRSQLWKVVLPKEAGSLSPCKTFLTIIFSAAKFLTPRSAQLENRGSPYSPMSHRSAHYHQQQSKSEDLNSDPCLLCIVVVGTNRYSVLEQTFLYLN
jgi:hypothetical protein